VSFSVVHDKAFWHCRTTVDRFDGDINEYIEHYGKPRGEREFYLNNKAYDHEVIEGNLLVNVGIAILLDLLAGTASPTAYNAANAYLSVGTGTGAAAAGDTALTAGVRKAMESTYPSRSSQTTTWKSSYGSGDANQAWQEWALFNHASAGTMLNRKVETLGTKASGTWTLEVGITIA
jgi:hypothetical protein